ncbi:MAG TPA: CAP domain-containing protein [Myxococcota bacterium]|nr:CAP domain-containing protein [Myxococcota bacterium]
MRHRLLWALCLGGFVSAGGCASVPDRTITPEDCVRLMDLWPADYARIEDQVLQLVNNQRAEGARCGAKGPFPAVGPLVTHPALTCAARQHAGAMISNNDFSHTSENGDGFTTRILDAGYRWSKAAENIAQGPRNPTEVMQLWMDSDEHCANLMGSYANIGIGYYGEEPRGWVQDFASP